ncbi:MAG: hypothetical protein K5669_02700 [Lachnospiraceae bacterium]|nr:hypothetical protein [Lachnospiraceae bacterium]
MAISLAACGVKEGSAQADDNEVVSAEAEDTVEVEVEEKAENSEETGLEKSNEETDISD